MTDDPDDELVQRRPGMSQPVDQAGAPGVLGTEEMSGDTCARRSALPIRHASLLLTV
jgi:hypothetical protein